ncbi:endonuclease/exonuclease/phosphatase family protein [Bacteriovoracaceae bacterium]|nr:endonuclease/exonuclease/phosphatase family protein [Bacteriovoracaceae bacterium]
MNLILTVIVLFSSTQLYAKSITGISYNAGLAYGFVHYAEQRRPHLLEALKTQNTDADIVCLQEVWNQSDIYQFKSQLKNIYPHSFSVEAKQTFTQNSPACRATNIIGSGKFGTCVLSNCTSESGDKFTDCIINTCRESMDTLKQENRECAAALFSQVGSSLIEGLTSVLNPFKKVGLFAYEGSTGLILLSKHPLKNKRHIDMVGQSTLNHRGALYAEFDLNNRTHQVVCTHLTADLDLSAPYTGLWKDWGNENKEQTNILLSYLEGSSTDGIKLLMGDFNSGPEFTGVLAELKNNHSIIEQAGYKTPIVDQYECSYCSDNTLVESKNNNLIDHVFYQLSDDQQFDSADSRIIYKNQVSITDDENDLQTVNLSDHFGVKVKISYSEDQDL